MDTKKRSITQNIVLTVLIVAFSALLILCIVKLVSSINNNANQDELYSSKVIKRDGVEYYPKQDITTLLIIGTDSSGEIKKSDYYYNDARADFVLLAIFNNTEKSYTLLNINRDTMLNMPILGVNGKNAGTFYGQLAVSHTYGSGLSDSCENTKKAVSDFLYGASINYYVSFNMSAISIINDSVGGVKVNVTEDFSAVDPSITMGEIILSGDQAFSYVRSRHGVGDQLNVSRMQRQEKYMNGFAEAYKNTYSGNEKKLLSLYDELSPYMVTDCSSNVLSNLASRYSQYEFKGVISPDGENKVGEKYMEFYADEVKLDELILSYLYEKKS